MRLRFSFRRERPQAVPPLTEALQDCLERLANGESSEQALVAHPNLAAQLRPLLQTALGAQAAAQVRPSAAARDTGRTKVAVAIEHQLLDRRSGDEALHEAFSQSTERLAAGASIEECLALYPSYANELRALFDTVTATRGVLHAQPSPFSMAKGRVRVNAAIEKRQLRGLFGAVWNWLPVRAWAATGAAAAVFGGGFGVVQASSGSLPNQTLYPVKRTVEQVEMAWTMRSDNNRTRFHDELARRRTEETAQVVRRGDSGPIVSLSGRAAAHVESATVIVLDQADRGLEPYRERRRVPPQPNAQDDLGRFRQRLTAHRGQLELDYNYGMNLLQGALVTAPLELQARVRLAMEILSVQYQKNMQQLDGRLEELSLLQGMPSPSSSPALPLPNFRSPTVTPLGVFMPR